MLLTLGTATLERNDTLPARITALHCEYEHGLGQRHLYQSLIFFPGFSRQQGKISLYEEQIYLQ